MLDNTELTPMTERNRLLEQALLKTLSNWNAEGIRADLKRNQHMSLYRESGGWVSPLVTGREAVDYLTRFINYFCDRYSGTSQTADIAVALAACATYWRTRGRPKDVWEANAVDALLVGFINRFAITRCMDLALYTKDLEKAPDLFWAQQIVDALQPTTNQSAITIELDGASWFAHRVEGFVNIQESPAGFGSTPQEALTALLSEEAKA